MTKLPNVPEVANCNVCKKTIQIRRGTFISCIPIEHQHEGYHCSGSDYSGQNPRYFILSQQQAMDVATFFMNDTSVCLNRPWAGCHSMSCGDGVDCANTRENLAKALSEFFLNHCVSGKKLKKAA